EADKSIEHHSKQCARFFIRRFLQQIITLHDIASGAAGEKLVVKHSNEKQACEARQTQTNLLHLQQNVPAKGSGYFYDQVCQNAHDNPAILGVPDSLTHLRAPGGIVIDPVKYPDGNAELENCDQDFLHSPKRSLHVSTDWRITSAVLLGLISHTNKQFVGSSGTSFSKFTSPVNGAS